MSPFEARRNIIERFISRWRTDVGDDFYPALRLIVPEKDRDRGMYGLKEKAIGRLLVKLLKITPSSEDGSSLLNWKIPGQTSANRMAGDFPGRCYEVLSKRSRLDGVGEMRIAEVNKLLDQLSVAQKEAQQLQIFEEFYNRMNATELMWLIRIILRQMKVGASERTFFDVSSLPSVLNLLLIQYPGLASGWRGAIQRVFESSTGLLGVDGPFNTPGRRRI